MQGVLIRIGAEFPERVNWVKFTPDGGTVVRSGSLGEVAKFCDRQRVTVLVPGQDVLLAAVNIPGRNLKQVRQAAPFALEDMLADDIDTMHVVVGDRSDAGKYTVAAVSHEKMTGWLKNLRAAGIEPHNMLPETLALAWEKDTWTILIEEHITLVRTGWQSGFAVDVHNLPTILAAERRVHSTEQDIPVRLYCLEGTGMDFIMPPGLVLQQKEDGARNPDATSMRFFTNGNDSGLKLNLLQGEYQRHAEWHKAWKVWEMPAVLLAVALLLYGGLVGSEFLRLRNRSRMLNEQIQQVYLETFPDAKHVNLDYPRLQMENKLNELRGVSTSSGDFLSLLALVGEELIATKGYSLKNLRFKEGVLDIDLFVQDLESLDGLKRRLSSQKVIDVEIKSASSKGGQVKARLLVQEKKG